MDKNILLDKFSKIFNVDKENMYEFFVENNLENFNEVLLEFEKIRNDVYSFLWETSEKEQLSNKMVDQLSKDFLFKNYSWINETGFNALKNYIFWISWHEGILKK